MNMDTGEFRALVERVDQLAAQLERYARYAATIRSFDQLCVDHMGLTVRHVTARRPGPRHLRPVGGGEDR